jgi:RNA polymerase sigma-70 factor (ECF subfamily)
MTTELPGELVRRLRDEGEPALAELFSSYRSRLERMVRFRMDPRLATRVDVADVLQEAYLDAAKRVDSYLANPEAPLFVWLRGITANTLTDVHRRHLGAAARDAGREVSLYRNAPDATSELLAARLVGRLTSPSHAAMRDETIIQMEQALRQMDETDREVLALRHFEQLANHEVAEVLGLSKTAASNRYTRALARLREILLAIPGLREQYGETSP